MSSWSAAGSPPTSRGGGSCSVSTCRQVGGGGQPAYFQGRGQLFSVDVQTGRLSNTCLTLPGLLGICVTRPPRLALLTCPWSQGRSHHCVMNIILVLAFMQGPYLTCLQGCGLWVQRVWMRVWSSVWTQSGIRVSLLSPARLALIGSP